MDLLKQTICDVSEKHIVLNHTGGTKIMSIAAMLATRGSTIELLYVSMEEWNLIYFGSETAKSELVPIFVKISVDST